MVKAACDHTFMYIGMILWYYVDKIVCAWWYVRKYGKIKGSRRESRAW